MTCIDDSRMTGGTRGARRLSTLWGRIAAVFDTPFDQRSRRIARRIEALRSLSDEELAARGLSRSQILAHVLRTAAR